MGTGLLELTLPHGRERLFAVWTRTPVALRPHDLLSFAERGELPNSEPYQGTRNMKRLKEAVQRLPAEDWHAVVLELAHDA